MPPVKSSPLRLRFLVGVTCLSSVLLAAAQAATVTFADGTFASYSTNYRETHFNSGNGDTQITSTPSTGGNPTSHLSILNNVSAAPGGAQSITLNTVPEPSALLLGGLGLGGLLSARRRRPMAGA